MCHKVKGNQFKMTQTLSPWNDKMSPNRMATPFPPTTVIKERLLHQISGTLPTKKSVPEKSLYFTLTVRVKDKHCHCSMG